MGLIGAPWKILPAVVNFGKIVKFWKPAVGQPLDSPAVAIRVIFARSDSMVRKVAFFYNVAFCDLSYNKNRNRIWKILGAPHNYFQLLFWLLGIWKLCGLSFSGGLTFPAFPSFFQISKIFQLMVQLFQPPQLLQLPLSSFLASVPMCRHRCGRTSRYGLAMGLCAAGKFCKNCQNLEAVVLIGWIAKFWKKRIAKFWKNLKIKI